MGRQIRLYIDLADAESLAELLTAKLGYRMFLPSSPKDEPVEVRSLHAGQIIMLFRNQDAAAVRPKYTTSLGERWFDHDGNSTIEWLVSREVEGKVHPGRFYYQPDFWLDGELLAKSDDFVRSSERLFRLIRANCQWVDVAWGRVRVGRNLESRLRAGDVELAMN